MPTGSPSLTRGICIPRKSALPRRKGGLTAASVVLLNQLRSVDKRRLVKRLGKVKPSTLENVERTLQISLGMLKV